MKKKLGTVLCCLLAGCSSSKPRSQIEIIESAKVDTAPLEYIHVTPSRRAIEYKPIDFDKLARKIRKLLSDEQINLSVINLIMVDYGALPALEADDIFMKYPCEGPKYYKNYNAKPARYFLNLKFYKCNQRPPAAPERDITVFLSKEKAPPYEAITDMAYEAVRDFRNYKEGVAAKKLEVDLSY